jgi:hypothetical protein
MNIIPTLISFREYFKGERSERTEIEDANITQVQMSMYRILIKKIHGRDHVMEESIESIIFL